MRIFKTGTVSLLLSMLPALSGPTDVGAFPIDAPFRSYTANQTNGIAVGDINEDGFPDIVSVSQVDNVLNVYLNDRSGQFVQKAALQTFSGPAKVVLFDVNLDSHLDAVITSTSNAVEVRLGDGYGTFASRRMSDVPVEPSSLCVGFVDHDSIPDVVVGNPIASTISVLKGIGDGYFQPPETYPVSSAPVCLSLIDLNHDGHNDVVCSCANNAVLLFRNKGDGTLFPPRSFPVIFPSGHWAGDINHDGKVDVITTRDDDPGSVAVLLGVNDSTLASPVYYSVRGLVRGIDVADLNNDGLLDIVVGAASANLVSVLFGDSPTHFHLGATYIAGSRPQFIAIRDLDGDGRPDFCVGASTAVNVFRNRGNGTFGPELNYVTQNDPRFVSTGDLNHDGRSDVAVGNFGSHSVSIYLSTGSGGMSAPTILPTSGAPVALRIEDLTGDGHNDLLVATQTNTLQVFNGSSNGSLSLASTYSLASGGVLIRASHAIACKDVDNDGNRDVLVSNHDSNTISVFRGVGGGTLGSRTDIPTTPGPESIVVVDLDNDGLQDLAVVADDYPSSLTTYRGTGGGLFQPVESWLYPPGYEAVVASDFDEDGLVDLVATGWGRDFHFYHGNGDCHVSFVNFTKTLSGPYGLACGDLNHDGHLDIVVANSLGCSVGVFLGDGLGEFAEGMNLGVGTYPWDVAVDDVTGDGWLDVVAPSTQDKLLTVLPSVEEITPIDLQDFVAVVTAGAVHISWRAGEEWVGGSFQVLRGSSETPGIPVCRVPVETEGIQQCVDSASPDLTLRYWLRGITRSGAVKQFGPISPETAKPEGEPTLELVSIGNPFTNIVRLGITSPRNQDAVLTIFNISGRLLRRWSRMQLVQGENIVSWDGMEGSGESVRSGIYFALLSVDGDRRTIKLIVQR